MKKSYRLIIALSCVISKLQILPAIEYKTETVECGNVFFDSGRELFDDENSAGEITFNPALFNFTLFSGDGTDSGGESKASLRNSKKHPFVALGGMMAFNILLLSWNRYMIGSGWAQVGPEDWKYFWAKDMEFDTDWYWTNFVLHPYQGSLYYMAARGANLNWLESFGVTFLGSYIWEFLGERNTPSINDMVYTSVASFGVGEMLYRLSMEANAFSKIFGVLVNPQRIWTEYLWRIKPAQTTGNIFEISLGTELGMTHTYTKILGGNYDYPQTEMFPVRFVPEFSVTYNDPYTHESNVPYSQFNLKINAGVGKGSGYSTNCTFPDIEKAMFYQIKIQSDGMLFSRTVDMGENKDTSLGMVMEYDFDWHSFYQVSSIAPGFAIKQRIEYEKSRIEWQSHIAAVLLGTSDFYYSRRQLVEEGPGTSRTYSYNVGLENVGRFKYEQDEKQAFAVDFHGYALYDFKEQLQSFSCIGWEFIGFIDLSYSIYLSDLVCLGVKDNLMVKYALYFGAPDVFQIVNAPGIFVKFQF